jgi:hypothetical protein
LGVKFYGFEGLWKGLCVRACNGVEPLYLDPNMVGWIKLYPNNNNKPNIARKFELDNGFVGSPA